VLAYFTDFAVGEGGTRLFFEKYINNPSPTGFEWKGQQMWLDYLKPYIDEYFTDNYGTAVGVINPKAKIQSSD
jgi:putative aminopeptidase FrvX